MHMYMVFRAITIRPARSHDFGPNRHIQQPVLRSEGCIGVTIPRTGSLQLPMISESFLTGTAIDGKYEPGDPATHLLAGSSVLSSSLSRNKQAQSDVPWYLSHLGYLSILDSFLV